MIPVCEPKLGKKELKYVTDCIRTNWISSKGKYINEFEEKFSKYCGAKYGIATCNGTTALHLALASLGIKTGDEVLCPAFTMIATANAITYTGAKPVLVDSEPHTWNIDPAKIEEKITKRTKAIMVMHTYGHPCDMDEISEIAKNHDLYVIEDAAEAHGAEYKGKKVGALGDAGCFSFYANKILTTGEGGMVVTNDEKIAEMCRLLRDQAFEPKRFLHRYIGFNYRMTNLQAAIGVAQMELIDKSVETRRRNARLYNSLLKGVDGISTPPEALWAKNVYWMYTVLIEDSFGMDRDKLMTYLKERGIETRSAFYPIHVQPVYAKQYRGEKYPVAEKLSREGINLPSGNTLTKDQIKYITEAILSAKEGK
ncbi:MAG: aminotransferase DegT [Hadesarchaea archaeon]|nr:MAG: aminotransferase DegT [Hadesarchaea archaeon]HDI12971.1 DegT/DnrJ/EryC1/StrS family aminotransferase [Hadesarchaea archaeon]